MGTARHPTVVQRATRSNGNGAPGSSGMGMPRALHGRERRGAARPEIGAVLGTDPLPGDTASNLTRSSCSGGECNRRRGRYREEEGRLAGDRAAAGAASGTRLCEFRLLCPQSEGLLGKSLVRRSTARASRAAGMARGQVPARYPTTRTMASQSGGA